MKRRVIVLVLCVLVVAGIDVLGDLTQDRPDRVQPGSRTEILLKVRNRDVHGSGIEGAQGLWGVCQSTLHNRLVPPGVVHVAGDHFRLVTEPAIGEHAWRRLRGCLEDLTVDQVLGQVITKRDLPPPH